MLRFMICFPDSDTVQILTLLLSVLKLPIPTATRQACLSVWTSGIKSGNFILLAHLPLRMVSREHLDFS